MTSQAIARRKRRPWRLCKSLTRTLVRWVYGLEPPRLAHVQRSAEELTPPAPLPPSRKHRLSIISSTPPFAETSTPIPNLFGELVKKRDKVQYTKLQNQCPLFTRLPPELRLQIYRFVLGDCTFHIIPSHAPSLTPPPRFSLRAQPFCTRLDFERCSKPERHMGVRTKFRFVVVQSHEMCTREGHKKWAASRLPKTDYENVTTEFLLEKWKRKGGPLALLKTCRVIYTEALPLLYTTNTFSFSSFSYSSYSSFLVFPSTLLPTRLPLLRHLFLDYRFKERQNWLTWPQCCAILSSLPSLQTLTITLSNLIGVYYSKQESELSSLRDVVVKGEFVVYVDWPEMECERELGNYFKIVRRKSRLFTDANET